MRELSNLTKPPQTNLTERDPKLPSHTSYPDFCCEKMQYDKLKPHTFTLRESEQKCYPDFLFWCPRTNLTILVNALLLPERASLSQPCLSSGRLAKDRSARAANDDGLGVREDGGDVEAPRALDVHEKGAWSRHKHLHLVLASLRGWVGVEKIFSENHIDWFFVFSLRKKLRLNCLMWS